MTTAPTRLGVLIVHGMGDQTDAFARDIVGDLERRLDRMGIARGAVFFCPFFWADVLEKRETDLLAQMHRSGKLDWRKVRRFVVHNLADAVAYRRASHDEGAVYDLVHDVIRRKLRQAALDIGDDTPVMLLAHSLGGAIMSDYIWDRQCAMQPGEGTLERLANLVGIVTFGCNIPLFTLALPRVQPILLPSPELSPRLDVIRPFVEWHNFYDSDDVLGWPLAQLYDTRADGQPNPRIIDHEIDVGNWKTSWNPMSHSGYWTDRSFTAPVAERIADIVRRLP